MTTTQEHCASLKTTHRARRFAPLLFAAAGNSSNLLASGRSNLCFFQTALGYQPRGGLLYYKGSLTYKNNNNKIEPVLQSKEILNLLEYLLIIFPIIYPTIAPASQL